MRIWESQSPIMIKAILDYNRALKLNPNLVDAYYNRGIYIYGQDQTLTMNSAMLGL